MSATVGSRAKMENELRIVVDECRNFTLYIFGCVLRCEPCEHKRLVSWRILRTIVKISEGGFLTSASYHVLLWKRVSIFI